MDALATLLRELWPRIWETIVALFSYHKGREDADRDARAARASADADALRRVLRAPRADGMQRDDAVSELRRRGLLRVSGKPSDSAGD